VNVSTASGATCSFTVTVTDTQAPTITCPANITVGNTLNQCNATVNYPDPSVTDNCPLPGTLSLTQNTNNNTIAVGTGIACGAGDNHFWRAYNLAPLALTSPLTIAGVRFGVEQNGTAQTATVRVYTSAGPFPASARTLVGTATVNITTAPATFYTASFTTPPTVPANAIVAIEVEVMNGGMWPGANQLGESAPAYVSSGTCGVPTPVTLSSLGFTSNTIIDLIGRVPVVPPVLTLVSGLPSGSVFPVGTTTNTWQARDAVGNTSTCSFTVTVVDNQQPNITCPANQTRNTDPGQCYATYTPPQPTFSDNCAVTRLTWSISGPGGFAAASPASGINYVPATQFPLDGRTGSGVSTVTYTAFDAAGNSRTCSFTVTVNDAERPVITQQPVTQYVCVNDNALFPVIANVGTGTILTYQWQGWNGTAWVNIAGATSATLTIPSVTFALNTNSYRCILSGRCTDVTSNFATLYINPLPTVNVVTSIPPVLTPGQVLSISSTVSPTGGTYRWYKNGTMLTNPLQQLSVLSGLTVDDIGSYQLEYTDLNGCKARSQTVVVSGQQSENLWVYPNPNSGQFQVRFYNTSGETATVRVFDEKGSQVYTKSMVTGLAYTRIDINLGPTIADGNYTVELVNGSGKRVGAKQIIVKKN
jgi:hypothetical protein